MGWGGRSVAAAAGMRHQHLTVVVPRLRLLLPPPRRRRLVSNPSARRHLRKIRPALSSLSNAANNHSVGCGSSGRTEGGDCEWGEFN